MQTYISESYPEYSIVASKEKASLLGKATSSVWKETKDERNQFTFSSDQVFLYHKNEYILGSDRLKNITDRLPEEEEKIPVFGLSIGDKTVYIGGDLDSYLDSCFPEIYSAMYKVLFPKMQIVKDKAAKEYGEIVPGGTEQKVESAKEIQRQIFDHYWPRISATVDCWEAFFGVEQEITAKQFCEETGVNAGSSREKRKRSEWASNVGKNWSLTFFGFRQDNMVVTKNKLLFDSASLLQPPLVEEI